MTSQDKQMLVRAFLRGQTVKDLGIFFACSERTVQTVLREAIAGLSDLNGRLGMELRTQQATASHAAIVETV